MRSAFEKTKAAASLVFFGMIALALSGCTQLTASQPVGTNGQVVLGQSTIDEKAWYAAEALYNIPAQAYVAAIETGQLPTSVKDRAKTILVRMNEARVAARTAYQANDAAAFDRSVTILRVLRGQIGSIIPGIPKGN